MKAVSYTHLDVYKRQLTYWGPVTINNEKYYMFIVDNEDSYTAGEITKLAEIIELAMGMWKYTPERDAKAEFIKALIRGNKSLAYTLKDEAKISGDDILSVFFSKGIGYDIESQVFAEFEKEEDLNIMKITEGDETYGMILTFDEDGANSTSKNSCVQLFNKLKGNKKARIFHVTGPVSYTHLDVYKRQGQLRFCRANQMTCRNLQSFTRPTWTAVQRWPASST